MHNQSLLLLNQARSGISLTADEVHLLATHASTHELMSCAQDLTIQGHGRRMGYSRKVFIPLTRLCRNH